VSLIAKAERCRAGGLDGGLESVELPT